MSWFSGLVDLIGQGANYHLQKDLAREDRQFNAQLSQWEYERNKEMAMYQNEWNLAQWNRQNEYNSPASQMDRFRAAGLNPNLMFSQGSPGLASSSPQAQGATYNARTTPRMKAELDFSKMFQTMLSLEQFDMDQKVKQAQIENIKANTDYTNQKSYNEGLLNNERGYKSYVYGVLQNLVGQGLTEEEIDKYSPGVRQDYLESIRLMPTLELRRLQSEIDRFTASGRNWREHRTDKMPIQLSDNLDFFDQMYSAADSPIIMMLIRAVEELWGDDLMNFINSRNEK